MITALWPTAVPVPATFGLCDGPCGATGSPSTSWSSSTATSSATPARPSATSTERPASGPASPLADTLAALHAVDVDAVGLGDFAQRDGYIERQLRRWYEQFRNSQSIERPGHGDDRGRRPRPWRGRQELAERIPPQRGTSIVHGDYRLDNTVLGDDGQVRAVLDWEICTLGDPLADLGLLMVYWTDPGDEPARCSA